LDIRTDIIKYLPLLKTFACKDVNGGIQGFIGILENKIEMLFVSPEYFGKGVGKALMDFAVKKIGVNEVCVNEQNVKAKEFYEHIGFRVVERMEKDEQGRAFALLRMKIG
jgi:putative acetyltransferase